jgi:hypothetical protein
MFGKQPRFPGLLLGRVFLVGAALVAAAGILVIAGIASDVLVLGPRPDRFWREFALDRWQQSVSLGIVLGAAIVAYTRFLYRRHRDFYVRFFGTPLRGRLKRDLRRENLRHCLPLLVALEAFIILAFWIGFAPMPGMLATFLFFPLLIGPSEEIRRLAGEFKRGTPASAT